MTKMAAITTLDKKVISRPVRPSVLYNLKKTLQKFEVLFQCE